MSPNGGNVCYSSVHVVQATVLDKSSKIDFVLPKDTFEYALNSATVRLLDVSIFIFPIIFIISNHFLHCYFLHCFVNFSMKLLTMDELVKWLIE